MRLIDADALYRKVKTECNPYGAPTIDFDDGCKVLDMIENTPTIELTIEERKTGRWLETEVFDSLGIEQHQSARCSCCGLYHTTPYMYYFDNYKFCPNCGASMSEDQERNVDNA